MTRWSTGSAVALAAVLASGGFAAADERPPQQLHLVGDHWTAWEPPASLPPDAEVHLIVAGDTLWELAAQYLGNPYLWPQLWESNQYILDAHWIYPGDPLVVGVKVEQVGDLTEAEGGAGEEGAPGEGEGGVPTGEEGLPGAVAGGAPVALGSESDIYCAGYIGEPEESFPLAIVGSESEAAARDSGSRYGGGQGTYGSISTLRLHRRRQSRGTDARRGLHHHRARTRGRPPGDRRGVRSPLSLHRATADPVGPGGVGDRRGRLELRPGHRRLVVAAL
jgi:hypothetical protein